MRLLFLTGCPTSHMAPPQLADEQIVAGPICADVRAPDGRWLTLRTAAGSYDLAGVLAKIPADQSPEAIVCFLDAGWKDAPRNLRCFGGTKVLLLANNLKKGADLSGLFHYVGREFFDRVMFLKDQAQLQRFLAGVVPGLLASLEDTSWPCETSPAQARAI
jgi:hypothetical protein